MNTLNTSQTTTCDNNVIFVDTSTVSNNLTTTTTTTTGSNFNYSSSPYVWTENGRNTYEIMRLISSILFNYGSFDTIQYTSLDIKKYYNVSKSVIYALCWIESYKDKNGK